MVGAFLVSGAISVRVGLVCTCSSFFVSGTSVVGVVLMAIKTILTASMANGSIGAIGTIMAIVAISAICVCKARMVRFIWDVAV